MGAQEAIGVLHMEVASTAVVAKHDEPSHVILNGGLVSHECHENWEPVAGQCAIKAGQCAIKAGQCAIKAGQCAIKPSDCRPHVRVCYNPEIYIPPMRLEKFCVKTKCQ